MAQDPRPLPPPESDPPQPQRRYDRLRDYLALPRFRWTYGAQHNAQEYWRDRLGGDQ